LGAGAGESASACWADRALTLGLILFALTVPHSIAAAQISLGLSVVAWAARDLITRRLRFTRTPIDLPLLCFAALTVASAAFSIEPGVSLPKLRSLGLFGIIYVLASNLRPRGARLLAALMIASGLVGAVFSLTEKAVGRGMTVTAINAESPLASGKLRAGDVIWMIARRRVRSLEDAAQVIRRHRAGETLEVEALHAGDPVPVELRVTDEIKARPNPLGVSVSGPTRRFRVSGFSRHFITYAEQMQILALFVYGLLLVSLREWRQAHRRRWLLVSLVIFSLFSFTLILTASRATIAAFFFALLTVAAIIKEWRVALVSLLAVAVLGGLFVYVLTSARALDIASFADDSSARRVGYMRAGLRLIPQHTVLGVGMDAHKRHWAEWGFPGDYVTHTHSTPIQIAMDRGLPALGCYVWLMAVMFLMTWRSYVHARSKGDEVTSGLMLGALGALIGFSASSLVNYNFGDSEVLMMLLFVVGVASAAREREGKKGEGGRLGVKDSAAESAGMVNLKGKSILWLAVLASALPSMCPQIAAQNPSSPGAAPQETIRLSTDLVVLDLQVVRRRSGEIINGLRAEDFELYEDGARQEITHFSQDRLSLSVMLLMDLSGSVSPVLKEIRDGALLALNRLKEHDEVAVMAFSSSTQLVQDFTRDRRLVVDKIGRIEKTPVVGQGTSLYQALHDAAHHISQANRPTSRRVIIAITDNVAWEYNFFGLSEKEVSDQVIESGSVVCGLVVEGAMTRTEKIFSRRPAQNDPFRRRMSIDLFVSQTGGEMVKAEKSGVSAHLALLIDHLRNRYSLGFSPKRELADGRFRQIRLGLTPEAQKRLGEVVIRTKQGYYARPRN